MMKILVRNGNPGRAGEYREVPEVEAFLNELEAVCKRHGMGISHEDGHGSFLVVDYDDDQLGGAEDAREAMRMSSL